MPRKKVEKHSHDQSRLYEERKYEGLVGHILGIGQEDDAEEESQKEEESEEKSND